MTIIGIPSNLINYLRIKISNAISDDEKKLNLLHEYTLQKIKEKIKMYNDGKKYKL